MSQALCDREDTAAKPDLGRLANNGMYVMMLQSALSGGERDIRMIPGLVSDIIGDGAWNTFLFAEDPSRVYRWNARQFRDFIEGPRPAGCQTPIHVLEKFLRDTEAWDVFLELTRGEAGGTNNPSGANQHSEVNRNIVPVDLAPDVIPFDAPPAEPPKRKRDYSRESKQGNSVGYAVRRLGKERPDLLEKVKARELSAHAAMVEAGFKQRQITIPVDPDGAARRLKLHFKGESLSALIAALMQDS